MKTKQLKQLIKQDFSSLHTENKKEDLLLDIQYIKQNKVTSQKKTLNIKYITATLSLACIMIFAFVTMNHSSYDYLVTLDVNPSIELQINKEEKVTNVLCYNEDGNIVLDDMDLKDVHVDVAVNAIIGSMYKHGYIDEIKNSVLVSVSGNDKDVRDDLKERVVNDIKETLSAYSIESSVISQSYELENKAKSDAKKYHISTGKAALIHEIIMQNPMYEFDDLALLSINDLNTLVHFNHTEFTSITINGYENRDGYLTYEQIKDKVLNHSKVNNSDIKEFHIEMISEKSKLLYYVNFKDDFGSYEYKINAISGEITYFNVEL